MSIGENTQAFCNRFMGVDIQYRKFGCNWEKPWRLKQVHASKNRKESVALEYFDTLEEVLAYMEGEVWKANNPVDIDELEEEWDANK